MFYPGMIRTHLVFQCVCKLETCKKSAVTHEDQDRCIGGLAKCIRRHCDTEQVGNRLILIFQKKCEIIKAGHFQVN